MFVFWNRAEARVRKVFGGLIAETKLMLCRNEGLKAYVRSRRFSRGITGMPLVGASLRANRVNCWKAKSVKDMLISSEAGRRDDVSRPERSETTCRGYPTDKAGTSALGLTEAMR